MATVRQVLTLHFISKLSSSNCLTWWTRSVAAVRTPAVVAGSVSWLRAVPTCLESGAASMFLERAVWARNQDSAAADAGNRVSRAPVVGRSAGSHKEKELA